MEEVDGQIINFDRICRLCLHEKRILTEIFEPGTGSNTISIDKKIMACATVKLSKDDGLPARICVKCLASLNAAFNFRIQCESSNKTLHKIHNILSNSKSEKDPSLTSCNNGVRQSEAGKVEKLQTINDLIIKNQEKEIAVLDNSKDVFYVLKNVDDLKKPQEPSLEDDVVYHNQSALDNQEFHFEEQETYIETLNEISFAVNEDMIKTFAVVVNSSANNKETRFTNAPFKKNESSLTDVKKSSCPFCHKILTRVDEHIRLLHGNRVYVCNKHNCGAEFTTLKNLQSHQLRCYNMKKAFKCSRCNKDFHRKSNFKAHIKRHTNKKEFQCQFCARAFVDSTGLKRHLLKHHEPEQEVFTSLCCGKMFKSKEGLKKHVRKSICGVQIFQCSNSVSGTLKGAESKVFCNNMSININSSIGKNNENNSDDNENS